MSEVLFITNWLAVNRVNGIFYARGVYYEMVTPRLDLALDHIFNRSGP